MEYRYLGIIDSNDGNTLSVIRVGADHDVEYIQDLLNKFYEYHPETDIDEVLTYLGYMFNAQTVNFETITF